MSGTVTLKHSKRKSYFAIALILIIVVVGVVAFFAYRIDVLNAPQIPSNYQIPSCLNDYPHVSLPYTINLWETYIELGVKNNQNYAVIAYCCTNGGVWSAVIDGTTIGQGTDATIIPPHEGIGMTLGEINTGIKVYAVYGYKVNATTHNLEK